MSRRSGTPLVVWAVLFAATCGCGGDGGVRAPSPTVAGIAFAPPAPVFVDEVDDVEPQIAGDGDGAWIAVWERETPIDGAALLHDVVAARSAGGGVRWDAPVGLSGGFVGFTPRLAGDRHADLVVVWEDRPGGDLAAARTLDGGITWETRFPVNAPGTRSNFDEVPGDYEVATDRAGTWIVVFTLDGTLGNSLVVAAASHDVGRTWEAPIALHAGASSDFQPTIAADGRGGWVIVWTSTDPLANLGGRSDGVGLLAVHSGDGGRTWSTPSAIVAPAEASLGDAEPQVATDGAGTWHVAWIATRDDGDVGLRSEVRATRSSDLGGTWTTPRVLSNSALSTANLRPRIGTDTTGRVVALWSTTSAANRAQIVLAQSADQGGTWTEPAPFPGGEVDYRRDGFPMLGLATDDRGAWRVAWSRSHGDAGPIDAPAHDVVVSAGAPSAAQSSGLAGRLVSPIR